MGKFMGNRNLSSLLIIAVWLSVPLSGCDGEMQGALDAVTVSNGPIHLKDSARFGFIGLVRTRSAREIRNAGFNHPFGIGAETTDRDYSSFDNWKDHLGPTGAMKVRLQSGWNDIEKVITDPPTYDFSKLDVLIDGALARGVQPFVFLGYGNERNGCVDCGTKNLGGALPIGAGQGRFLKFVKATVNRYKTRVSDWEIWNEPDGHVQAEEYSKLLVKAAREIKAVQSSAKITIGSFTAGVMGGANTASSIFAKTSVDYFAANKGSTVPDNDVAVGYHPYYGAVDHDNFPGEFAKYKWFKSMVEAHGFRIRQTENGAPSKVCKSFALCGPKMAWTEEDQAKYLLRRLLGDFYRGVESSIFTLVDLHYDFTKNDKGLLQTGTWDSSADSQFLNGDQTVKRKKVGYRAFQHVTAIFDNRLTPIHNAGCTVKISGVTSSDYTVQAYTRKDGNGAVRNLIAAWRKVDPLPKVTVEASVDISCDNFHFPLFASNNALRPRLVDMVDGRIYSLERSDTITVNNSAKHKVEIKNLSLPDYPVLLADQGLVHIAP
ncbi:MAG TPA: hypothetical protein VE954_40255 [Oligoflexus sp.]|uniref:hypothetical protein n=1 Tax=Oligoflexus sp. TaxID=1971216 RepID=UPI002D36BBD9|nr:hypothetical protein [Oligoflexus sp.]HYX39374.1 hypothetical protein [Oligoflexus sp.]